MHHTFNKKATTSLHDKSLASGHLHLVLSGYVNLSHNFTIVCEAIVSSLLAEAHDIGHSWDFDSQLKI